MNTRKREPKQYNTNQYYQEQKTAEKRIPIKRTTNIISILTLLTLSITSLTVTAKYATSTNEKSQAQLNAIRSKNLSEAQNNNNKVPRTTTQSSPSNNSSWQSTPGDKNYLANSRKGINIINNSKNNTLSCSQIAQENKEWIPGGWTIICADNLNPKDTQSSDTAGLTYYDKKQIVIRNAISNTSIESVMMHELAHAYNITYLSYNDEENIANALHHPIKDFYSDDYKNSPAEMWARGYSYCYTGIKVDFTKYPPLSCNKVIEIVENVKKHLGINLEYKEFTNPKVPLNDRKLAVNHN